MAGRGAYLAWLACVSYFWCDSPRLLDSLVGMVALVHDAR